MLLVFGTVCWLLGKVGHILRRRDCIPRRYYEACYDVETLLYGVGAVILGAHAALFLGFIVNALGM